MTILIPAFSDVALSRAGAAFRLWRKALEGDEAAGLIARPRERERDAAR
jgi:hypothetical protein